MLTEQEITRIINAWQEARISDFEYNKEFNTGRVIAQRKRITGQTFAEVVDFLTQFKLELHADFTIIDLLKKKKESKYILPILDLSKSTAPPKDFSKSLKKQIEGVVDGFSFN